MKINHSVTITDIATNYAIIKLSASAQLPPGDYAHLPN